MPDQERPPTDRSEPRGVPLQQLRGGVVRRLRSWVVGVSDGEPFAVSARCRHQLADLSKGKVDTDGCLVCPWHGARYDVRSGHMVQGPRGFLGYHGPTWAYGSLVAGYTRFLPLRRRAVTLDGEDVTIE